MIAQIYLLAAAVTLASAAGTLPRLPKLDQSPSTPGKYGQCEAIQPQFRVSSHWCKLNEVKFWPEQPNAMTRKTMKLGRQTVYNGPLGQHLACGGYAKGNDDKASVAISTKYFKTFETEPTRLSKYCGQCLCMVVLGADKALNPGPQMDKVDHFRGLAMMASVQDQCSECQDDSIDVLLDRPYAFNQDLTENARKANAVKGVRGSSISPFEVGAFGVAWNFAPCSWTHADCKKFAQDALGITYARTPTEKSKFK